MINLNLIMVKLENVHRFLTHIKLNLSAFQTRIIEILRLSEQKSQSMWDIFLNIFWWFFVKEEKQEWCLGKVIDIHENFSEKNCSRKKYLRFLTKETSILQSKYFWIKFPYVLKEKKTRLLSNRKVCTKKQCVDFFWKC